MNELNSTYTGLDGRHFSRLAARAFNLEDADAAKKFLKGEVARSPCPAEPANQIRRFSASAWECRGWARARPSPVGACAFPALRKLDQRAALPVYNVPL